MNYTLNTPVNTLDLQQERTYEDWKHLARQFCESYFNVLGEKPNFNMSPRELFFTARWGADAEIKDYFTLLMFAHKDDARPIQAGLERFQQYEGDFQRYCNEC